MYFSGKRLERMIYILDVFAGDLEVRLCKNCTVIFSFSRSIKRYSFYCICMKSKIRPSWYDKISNDFSVTIQNVENRSYTLWRYQRFLIINEFCLKSPIPPPFNIFYYLFSIFNYLIKFIRKSFIKIRQRFSRDNRSINNQGKFLINILFNLYKIYFLKKMFMEN